MRNLNQIIDSCQEPNYEDPWANQTYLLSDIADKSTNYAKLLFELLEKIPPLNISKGPWLAGGSIRRFIENTAEYDGWDFDFFFRNEEQRLFYQEALLSRFPNVKTFDSKRGDTYLINFRGQIVPIQFIKLLYFSNPTSVINTFDFTQSQIVTDGCQILVGKLTLNDIKDKVLQFNQLNEQTGISTVRRFMKFANEGYKISNAEISKFLRHISSSKPEDLDKEKGMSPGPKKFNVANIFGAKNVTPF